MSRIFISCKKAAELIEKKQAGYISLGDRWRLWLHIYMCSLCAVYERQSQKIQALLRVHLTRNKKELSADKGRKEALKEKILKKINEES